MKNRSTSVRGQNKKLQKLHQNDTLACHFLEKWDKRNTVKGGLCVLRLDVSRYVK